MKLQVNPFYSESLGEGAAAYPFTQRIITWERRDHLPTWSGSGCDCCSHCGCGSCETCGSWSETWKNINYRPLVQPLQWLKCDNATAEALLNTWNGCDCENTSGGAWHRGGPRWAGSFCRSPPCRRASPELSSCQSRAWTRSPPHSSGPYGCRRRSPPPPASCSPAKKSTGGQIKVMILHKQQPECANLCTGSSLYGQFKLKGTALHFVSLCTPTCLQKRENKIIRYLQVLPATATGKILNNKAIISPYRWTISVSSSPASISTFQGNKETERRMRTGKQLRWCTHAKLQATHYANV